MVASSDFISQTSARKHSEQDTSTRWICGGVLRYSRLQLGQSWSSLSVSRRGKKMKISSVSGISVVKCSTMFTWYAGFRKEDLRKKIGRCIVWTSYARSRRSISKIDDSQGCTGWRNQSRISKYPVWSHVRGMEDNGLLNLSVCKNWGIVEKLRNLWTILKFPCISLLNLVQIFLIFFMLLTKVVCISEIFWILKFSLFFCNFFSL